MRTGPAKFEAGERIAAPLVRRPGDAAPLLVRRGPRLLRQPLPAHAEPGGPWRRRASWRYSEFATDPCRSLFARVASMFRPGAQRQRRRQRLARGRRVHRHDRDAAARRLRSRRRSRRPGVAYEPPGHAHAPRTRTTTRERGELRQLRRAASGPRSHYRFYAQRSRDEQRVIGRVGVREPGYMHSFGLTERYLVLAEGPFVVNPLRLATSGRPYIENYRWEPERGDALPRLRPRDAASCAASYETDAVLHLPPRQRLRARRRARRRPVRL